MGEMGPPFRTDCMKGSEISEGEIQLSRPLGRAPKRLQPQLPSDHTAERLQERPAWNFPAGLSTRRNRRRNKTEAALKPPGWLQRSDDEELMPAALFSGIFSPPDLQSRKEWAEKAPLPLWIMT